MGLYETNTGNVIYAMLANLILLPKRNDTFGTERRGE